MFKRTTTLMVLVSCGSLMISGQTPPQTSTPKPSASATSQTRPQPPEIKDPEVKAFVEEVSSARPLFTESTKFMTLGTPESKAAALAQLLELIERSRGLYEKLSGKTLSENIAQTGEPKAHYQTLLKLFQSSAHMGLGNLYEVSRDWQDSVNHKKLSLAILQEILADPNMRASKIFNQLADSLKRQELGTLAALATTLAGNLDQPAEALAYANQTLMLARRLQREDEQFVQMARFYEAFMLQRIGLIHLQMDDRHKAIESYKQALSVYQLLPDQKRMVAMMLFGVGSEYFSDVDYENALKYLNDALKVAEEIDDQAQQTNILVFFALIQESLGNEAKAREFWRRQLAILLSPDYTGWLKRSRSGEQKVSEANAGFPDIAAMAAKNDEYIRLLAIANTYRRLKDYAQALSYYEQAMPVARSIKSPSAEQVVWSSAGNTYIEKEDWQKALDYYGRALEISRQLPQKSLAASDLQNIAYVYFNMKNWQVALHNANEALLIYLSLGAGKENLDRGYASTLSVIARTQEALGNRRLAIFYGKQAVNAIQRERQQLKTLDPESQRGFLKQNEKVYRRLSDWLIADGRFAEAEQVLTLLKEEEYSEYVPRDADEIKNLKNLEGRLSLRSDEQKLIERYTLLADRVTAIGMAFQKLDDKRRQGAKLPDEEQKRYGELVNQLKDANAAFALFLEKEVAAELRKPVVNEIELDRALQEDLRKWGKGAVALYTVVGEDRYRVILTTPTVQVDGRMEIKAAALNEKIFKFRSALQNPSIDPRPLGKELYDILIKPIEKELSAANAKTLIWSLDGALRYIPFAALSPDGKTYLVEKYQTVVITSKTRQKLTDGSAENWHVLGLGVSTSQTVSDPIQPDEKLRFGALPGVKTELTKIVRDEQSPQGLLMGKRLVDTDFNVNNFEDSLTQETRGKRKYTVVHIASHFRLGDDNANSFLLLGDGKTLTLKQVVNSPRMSFGNIELVTLSACNTAFGSGAASTGKEVDSLATFIELRGAKAILATLWSVADESTSLLMSAFYRLHKANPKLTKAEAMQLAQRAMLQGKYKAGETPLWRGPVIAGTGDNQSQPFNRDSNAPYAHPYYWSPFILIGNWR